MNFLAFSFQPAAGAAGITFRVQLPASGRPMLAHSQFGGKALPPVSGAETPRTQRVGPIQHRAQHRVQCRSNCMSKANF